MENEKQTKQNALFVFVKFAASSLSAVVVDLIVFQIVTMLLAQSDVLVQVWGATVIARVVSATYHYAINRNLVFHDEQRVLRTLIAFFALQFAIMCASAAIVSSLASICSLPSVAIKIVVDACLFFVNYAVQKLFIFTR